MRTMVIAGLSLSSVLVLMALYQISLSWSFSVERQYVLFPLLAVSAELLLIGIADRLLQAISLAGYRKAKWPAENADEFVVYWLASQGIPV